MPPSLTSIMLYLINFHLHILVPSFGFCRSCFLNDQLFLQSFRAYSKKLFSSKDHIQLIFLKNLIFSSRSMHQGSDILLLLFVSLKRPIFLQYYSPEKVISLGFFFSENLHPHFGKQGGVEKCPAFQMRFCELS